MFQRILVPLDGSKLAETALPVATAFAERCGAELILFHVIEKGAAGSIHGEHHLQNADEAQAYLNDLAVHFATPEVTIENHVHTESISEVPNSIIQHALEFEIDLIVMCAHGSSGLRDRLIGSIAQQVIQRGTTPVLFFRPEMDFEQLRFPPQHILVPLDGEGLHEDALPAAKSVAEKCGAAIELVTVVPTPTTLRSDLAGPGMMMPITTSAMLDLAERGAAEYLLEIGREISEQKLRISGHVLRGDAAVEILKVAEQADLIIMATHGRTNWDAFWQESVTPKVMGRTKIPVLLVREP